MHVWKPLETQGNVQKALGLDSAQVGKVWRTVRVASFTLTQAKGANNSSEEVGNLCSLRADNLLDLDFL